MLAVRPAGMDLTRRQVLAALLSSGALAACSGPAALSASDSPTSSTSSGAPEPSGTAGTNPAAGGTTTPATTTTAALPATSPWRARRGEVEPAVKARATALIEAVGAWTGGRGDAASARDRAARAGFAPALADSLAPLLGAGTAAAVSVRDAQYGGIASSSASVLVVVDQWRTLADGPVAPGGTTVDVRLVEASPLWRIVEVLPARPGAASSRLGAAATQVLSEPRIRLPHAARADVSAGAVHDTVLELLVALAARHVVDVSVLRSGHPLHVFGTSRTSDHLRGRAVDVWALDGRPLVLAANHALASSAERFAVAHGAYNVGGPVPLGGPQYFSDRTHQDHVHLGFDS